MIPIVQCWSPFTPLRNFDQLRTSLARHRANAKIVTPHPRVLNGRPYKRSITIALYGLEPFSHDYYTSARVLAGRFLWAKMIANADHI